MTDIDQQRQWAQQAQQAQQAQAWSAGAPQAATPAATGSPQPQPQWGVQPQPQWGAPPAQPQWPAQPFGAHAPAHRSGAYQRARADLMRQLWIGLAFLAIGVTVTVGGYLWAGQRSAESGEGSSYLVLWGPALFGLLRTGRAVLGLIGLRDERV